MREREVEGVDDVNFRFAACFLSHCDAFFLCFFVSHFSCLWLFPIFIFWFVPVDVGYNSNTRVRLSFISLLTTHKSCVLFCEKKILD